MAICELVPKYKIGPIKIGREIGQEVTTFPQFREIKALHKIGWAILDNHAIYGEHKTMVEILSPHEIRILRCLDREPCSLTSIKDRVFCQEGINQQFILNDNFRWIKKINTPE